MSNQIEADETTKDDTPTAYGVELDSVAAVANACLYLDEPYNAGHISVRTSEELVIIQSRGAHFAHMETLLEAQKQGHISIQHITTGTNRVGDPCLNIEVVGGNDSTETTDKDDTPTVNGVELDSVAGVANALSYLDDPWIAGDITVRSSEDLVIIHSRQRHFGHVEALLEAEKQGHISIQHIAAGTNRDGGSCLNIEVVGGNDSTEKTDKDATLTEYLTATDNTDNSIDGAAKITHTQNDTGVWQTDDGEELEDDLDEYRAECSCGEEFGSWVKATRHVGEE